MCDVIPVWTVLQLYSVTKGPNLVPELRGAPLAGLVDKLTSSEFVDPNFTFVFLLTYRSFTTGKELIHKLKQRFLTRGEDETDPNKISSIQLRVVNVIRQWLENYFDDFEADDALLAMLVLFISEHIERQANLAGLARLLKKVMCRKLEGQEKPMTSSLSLPNKKLKLRKKSVSMFNSDGPADDILSQDPADIAEQLTLISSHIFRQIRAKEFLNQNWSKSPDLAPNITALINRFNALSLWVEVQVLSSDDPKRRAVNLSKLIRIASECEKLQNYNDAKSLVAGINSAAVFRLKKTWEKVKDKDRQTLEDMNKLIDGNKNFAELRSHLAKLEPPTIPYLGMFLTDLVFIEQGNHNMIKDHENVINFEKRRKMAFVIRQIKQLQQEPYPIEEIKPLRDALMEITCDKTQDETYELSLLREPRIQSQPSNAQLSVNL
eukprot:c20054_g1_i4.p1 GENE.c20054_g1_i4~~c20054_g1_i4.p1  ORF type:complete len:435 (+),score=136.95 c20054_g1_i4:37-1341(+)